MLNNVRLGVKLAAGFGVVLAIALATSLVNLSGIVRIGSRVDTIAGDDLPAVQNLGVIRAETSTIRTSLKSLLIPYLSEEDRAVEYDNIAASRRRYEAAWSAYEALPRAIEEDKTWTELGRAWGEWKAANDAMISKVQEIERSGITRTDAFESNMNAIISDHHALVARLESYMLTGRSFEGGDDPTLCRLGRWMAEGATQNPMIDEAVEQLRPQHDLFHLAVAQIKSLTAAGRARDALNVLRRSLEPARDVLLAEFAVMTAESQRVVGLYDEAFTYSMMEQRQKQSKAVELLDELAGIASRGASDSAALTLSESRQSLLVGAIGMAVALVLAAALSLVITLGITRPVARGVEFARQISQGKLDVELPISQRDEIGILADALRAMVGELRYKAELVEKVAGGDLTAEVRLASNQDGLGASLSTMSKSLNGLIGQVAATVDQLTAGTAQVSQASQSLSQGASEQASSLEEISSSLTEVASQSRQNAESAGEADSLARAAMDTAASGNAHMQELLAAMTRIGASSAEIRKVVKLIDDIAFQTNLLALNANVEAARAGKYGKGFAVVAEEVRALAARSSGAVRETTAMVEQSVESISAGTAAADATARQLEAIVSSSSRVADLLARIAVASKDQAKAVEEIDAGLSQIGQVTQSNTASAEECAASAEELSAQAEHLRSMVGRFHLRGNGKGSHHELLRLTARS